MDFYEHLVEDENFIRFEKETITLYRDLVEAYMTKGDEYTKGRLQGVKEVLMMGVNKMKNEKQRIKFKEELKKKISGVEREVFIDV